MRESIQQTKEEAVKTCVNLASFRVSFMNICNVTMVSVIVENFQIQKAVDVQRRMNCEMQLNFDVNVHVAVHSSTLECNKSV